MNTDSVHDRPLLQDVAPKVARAIMTDARKLQLNPVQWAQEAKESGINLTSLTLLAGVSRSFANNMGRDGIRLTEDRAIKLAYAKWKINCDPSAQIPLNTDSPIGFPVTHQVEMRYQDILSEYTRGYNKFVRQQKRRTTV